MGNTDKPKRRLLTTFDIVLIAVVVVIAALFLVWKASQNTSGDVQTVASQTVRFTMEFIDVVEELPQYISEGDALVETTKNTSIGEVVSYSFEKTKVWKDDLETGGLKMLETDAPTALITAEVLCDSTDSAFLTKSGGIELRVGEPIGIYGPGYWAKGYIVAVERG